MPSFKGIRKAPFKYLFVVMLHRLSSRLCVPVLTCSGSKNITGTCYGCDALPQIDTEGVYEFDTTTDTLVGNHVMKEGVGGDPFPTPDGGKYF